MSLLDKDTTRQIIIAKIKKLKKLNAIPIDRGERWGAEIDYRKICCRELKAMSEEEKTRFSEIHPRYQELIDIYGAPEDCELKIESSAIKSSLITVKIQCETIPDAPVTTKKLLLTLTVQKLKTLVQRLYKIKDLDGDAIVVRQSALYVRSGDPVR